MRTAAHTGTHTRADILHVLRATRFFTFNFNYFHYASQMRSNEAKQAGKATKCERSENINIPRNIIGTYTLSYFYT